jgi:hypothetical protein
VIIDEPCRAIAEGVKGISLAPRAASIGEVLDEPDAVRGDSRWVDPCSSRLPRRSVGKLDNCMVSG